jgi:hypothetical protein
MEVIAMQWDSTEWTTNKPTKPGLYWALHLFKSAPQWNKPEIIEINQDLCRTYCNCEGIELSEYQWFMGPIKVPALPEGI